MKTIIFNFKNYSKKLRYQSKIPSKLMERKKSEFDVKLEIFQLFKNKYVSTITQFESKIIFY